ncbi:hypothetical protein EYF80_040958 [Liparis tanakae]|uniref:Uncharacterized protein n=1 Tax=Liparis tanakae TaxID=230148 RepID=A0A4Z2G7Q5_9TELE|nr:hypothetical protein EYF80_040958 [Liparis tanakae]
MKFGGMIGYYAGTIRLDFGIDRVKGQGHEKVSVTLAALRPQKGEELSPGSMEVSAAPVLVPSPRSEAVTTELQELSLQPGPIPWPLQERKNERETPRGLTAGPRRGRSVWLKLREEEEEAGTQRPLVTGSAPDPSANDLLTAVRTDCPRSRHAADCYRGCRVDWLANFKITAVCARTEMLVVTEVF